MIYLVQHFFEHSARRFPDKPAVCCQDQSISYRELDALSNALARELRQNGVERGQYVGFFLKKSIASIQSILGILKADCAYVPLDVESPADRLNAILGRIEARIIIVDDATQAIIEALLPAEGAPRLLNIDRFTAADNAPLEYRNLSIDLAYVLFTSGSTGIPKGVMIPHKAIIDYIDWCVEVYQLDDRDIIANHAPLYFDNSTFDIYTAFKSGATLHLVHDELNAVLPSLVQWLDQREITTFFCVPSVLTLLMRSRRLKPERFASLRHVICAGEALPPASLRFWMERYPHIRYTNMYGPTEITVDCSFYFVPAVPDETTLTIPIGYARSNMELLVRGDNGELSQRPGARGELLVRGTSVACGYLGEADKTRQAFIQNPRHDRFHDPVYCTGDLVEIDQHGQYLFLGRKDDQIKYLGHRIELGEIEAALLSLAQVSEAVVAFCAEGQFGHEQAEIGVLVKLAQGDHGGLREALKLKLPPYMLPTRYREHDGEYPRTPNGKYDRKAIARIVFEAD